MPETPPEPPRADKALLTKDDVAKVAQLAMLELTDADLEMFTGQLDAVLHLADQLEAFDVDDVPPTSHPFGLSNVLRPDVAEHRSDAEAMRREALAGAPEIEGDRFKVPPALGEAP